MAITLRRITLEDIPRVTDIYFAAFAGNPVQERIFPTHAEGSHKFWEAFFVSRLEDPTVHFQAAVEQQQQQSDGQEAEKMHGFSMWMEPLPADKVPEPPLLPPREALPAESDRDGALAFLKDLEHMHHKLMGDPNHEGRMIPHWYLGLIAVDPQAQGKGVATPLLRYAEDKADAAQVPCYLDATPAGRPVYASPGHGFRVLMTKEYFGVPQTFMLRDPRGPPATANGTAEVTNGTAGTNGTAIGKA